MTERFTRKPLSDRLDFIWANQYELISGNGIMPLSQLTHRITDGSMNLDVGTISQDDADDLWDYACDFFRQNGLVP